MLSAQGFMQTGVQASLPDLSFQLQNQRTAPLVLLPEHGGNVWPCFLNIFHLLTARSWMSHEADRCGQHPYWAPSLQLCFWAWEAPKFFLAESSSHRPSCHLLGVKENVPVTTCLSQSSTSQPPSGRQLPAEAHLEVWDVGQKHWSCITMVPLFKAH